MTGPAIRVDPLSHVVNFSGDGQAGDPTAALQAAATALAPALASCATQWITFAKTADGLASLITDLADKFIEWLRKPVRIRVSAPVIFEQDSGQIVTSTGGTSMASTDATFDSSQGADWALDPEDDRGFNTDTVLVATVSPDNVVSLELDTERGEDGAYHLRASAIAATDGGVGGPALVTVSVQGADPAITVGLAVNVEAGGVSVLKVGDPTIFEQPTAPPPGE